MENKVRIKIFISCFPSGNIIAYFSNGAIFSSFNYYELTEKIQYYLDGEKDFELIKKAWNDDLYSTPEEFRDPNGEHIFTDRGNRLSFDREIVTDAEIRAALEHAHEKFGNAVKLIGDDPVFKERMAKIAIAMGLTLLP